MEAPRSERVIEVSEKIKRILHGMHPAEQGMVLADMLAIWLAGHRPQDRDRLIDVHIAGVRQLIPFYEKHDRRGSA